MKKELNNLAIAKIIKPQGIKGEIKILPLVDSPRGLSSIKAVIVNGINYTVDSFRVSGDFCYIKLDKIADRNMAETLRDAEILVAADNRPKLPQNRYYVDDVIGLKVCANGAELGTISQILQHGSADVYCITGEKNFMFPAIQQVILSYDIDNGAVIVDSAELEKVAVYED